MRRRSLASALLVAPIALVLAAACLPDLTALRGAPDAGEDASAVTGGCGDGFIDDDAGESCDPRDLAATTCTNCVVQCPGTIDPASRHCYYVARTDATYTDAKAACTASGGHVVTIGSDHEADFVDRLSASSPYWVGVSYQAGLGGYGAEVTTEPGFLADAGCPGCYVPALTASDGGTECVVSSAGGWRLSSCSATATTVCEREPVGLRSFYCQGPYCATVTFTLGTKRYLLYRENGARTASEAAAECAGFDGGRLAVFGSREEREQIVDEVLRLRERSLEPASFTAWIGIASDGGTWTWDDGTPVDDGGRPSPWGAARPDASAQRAFIRVGPAFFDSQLAQTGDDVARPFICERK